VRDEREEVKIKKAERKRRIKRRVRARNEEKNREGKIVGFEMISVEKREKIRLQDGLDFTC
jgi:hypothetical protein